MALAMPPKQAAAVAEFEEQYESLKKMLQSFRRDEFLLGLIKIVRDHEGIPFEEYAKGKPLPWTMLTLIKLACEHCGESEILVKATHRDFVETYRKTYDLEEAYGTAILLGNMICFFFSLAQHQFWHQVGLHSGTVARLNYFFCSDQFKRKTGYLFKNIYGIEASKAAELLITTWVIVKTSNQLMYELPKKLEKLFQSSEGIQPFLSLVSIDIDAIGTFIRNRKGKITSAFFQFGERTPFLTRPLIRVTSDGYVPVSLKIIERAGDALLYESIKTSGSEELIKTFADTFESYVFDLLNSSGLAPWGATDIENIFDGKTTDFIVPCADKTVFIEAKSVRLGNMAIAHPVSENIPNDLKDNVIKALIQGFDLARALADKCQKQNIYLLVVTYDDLHLGSPGQAWDSFFKDYFINDEYGYDVTKYISPSNIFIVGIREFEQICNYCKNADMLSDLLEKAVTDNAQPQTTKFSLTQSLPPDVPSDRNPIIKANFDLFFSRITTGLPG